MGRLIAPIAVAVLGAWTSGPALAQAASPPATPAAGAAGSSDIVVTAQRREQTVQTVAASITAISSAQLGNAHIQDPADIAKLTPGLSTLNRTADSLPTFSIRGIGLDDFNPNNTSATAVYIDGVYQSGSVFLAVPIFDVSRVEILKGPQGTLYGQNATGGAINFISKQPTDQFNGFATAGYGRYGTVDLSGAVGGPLGNGFSARIAGVLTHQGHGFQTDEDTGKKYGATRRYAGRALLKYDTGTFSTVLNVHAGHDYSVPSSYEHDQSGDADSEALFDTLPLSAKRVRVGDLDLRRRETSFGASLTTTIDLNFANLVSILAYDHLKRFIVDNNDGNPQPVYDITDNDRVSQFYEETRLASKEPLFGRVNWILGTNYSLQRFHGKDATDQSTFYVGAYETPPDFFTRGLSVASATYLQKPSSLGFFVNTTTNIASAFRVVLGGRYTIDKVHADGVTLETGSADGGVLFNGVGSVVDAVDQTQTRRRFDYRAGLEYDVARDILLYATTSTGTKSGLFYLGPAVAPGAWHFIEPEKLTSYEVGLKTALFDHKLTFNIAGFYYNYKDRQTSLLYVPPTPNAIFGATLANIPKARVKGFEIDSSLRPLPGLVLNGGLTYLDAKIIKTIDNIEGFALFGPADAGTTLAQSPKWTYTIAGAYGFAISDDLKANLSLNFQHSSRQSSSAFGGPFTLYGPNADLDGRASVTYRDDFTVALWGKNLTDNDDFTTANPGLIGRTVFIRKPISYGLELTKTF